MDTLLHASIRLSPRERAVASLYSQGLSARRVAEKLSISPRTVEVHIRHIYEKLGIHSRDDLIEQYASRL